MLPLISTFEKYEITFWSFVIYHRYAKEAERFRAGLQGQRTIFELLFMAASRRTNSAEDFRDPSYLSQNNEDFL
jgi:hypothetical protein